MEAETIGDTHDEMETNALLDTLAYMLADVELEALVNAVVVKLAQVKAKTLNGNERVGRQVIG